MSAPGESEPPDSISSTARFQAAVGEALRAARLYSKNDHETAAAGAKCSPKCVRKNETANANPRLHTFYRLCRNYGLPFSVVAILIDLRREGYIVPFAKAFEVARRIRRMLLKIVRF